MNLRQITSVGIGISVGLCFALLLASEAGPTDYTAAIEKWRQERETRLKADGGWLTVAGLFWLKEGENRFGTDPTDDIVLPPGSAPAWWASSTFTGGRRRSGWRPARPSRPREGRSRPWSSGRTPPARPTSWRWAT